MTNRMHPRLSLVLSATVLVALAGGCSDRSSDADKAIRAQARELQGMTGGSPHSPAREVESRILTAANQQLTPHASGSDKGEASAASLMVAQSNLGLAEHAMTEVGNAEQESARLMSRVDQYLNHWRRHHAVKAAAESYNPAAELAEIAKAKAEKDTAIAAEKSRGAQLQAQLDDLKAKAKQKMDAVAEREAEYGRLMEQAAKVSATQGISLVEQANGIKREADMLRMAGTKLEAQAGVVEPQVREANAIIQQLENQKKDMEGTEAALAAHLAASRDEASKAAAAANEAAGKITAAVTDVSAARELTQAAYQKAEDLYNKAVRAARESTKDSQTAARALSGDANLSLAYLHWQRAQGLRLHAGQMRSLATVKPALSDAATYAAKAEELDKSVTESLTAAGEAMETAKQAFESTAIRGQGAERTKERLDALGAMLATAKTVSADQGTNVSPELAGLAGINAAASSLSSSSGSAAPSGDDPKATLAALIAASKSGDQNAAMALVDWPAGMREAMAPMAQASERLDKAFKAKFGKGMNEAIAADPQMAAMAGGMNPAAAMGDLGSVNLDDVNVVVTGDTAKATVGGNPLDLKKVDGKWLIALPAQATQQMAMAKPMFSAMATAMQELAGEIEAGTYADANAALQAMGAKMQAAMMKMMGG